MQTVSRRDQSIDRLQTLPVTVKKAASIFRPPAINVKCHIPICHSHFPQSSDPSHYHHHLPVPPQVDYTTNP
jgi:hypothetical protein